MRSPINLRMLSHPMNWIVVTLMLVIAGTAGHLLLTLAGVEPKTATVAGNAPAGQQQQSQ